MPRLMFVIKSLTVRQQFAERLASLKPLFLDRSETAKSTLEQFRADPEAVMICHPGFALMGFKVPADTLITLGPGFDEAQQAQIYARARD